MDNVGDLFRELPYVICNVVECYLQADQWLGIVYPFLTVHMMTNVMNYGNTFDNSTFKAYRKVLHEQMHVHDIFSILGGLVVHGPKIPRMFLCQQCKTLQNAHCLDFKWLSRKNTHSCVLYLLSCNHLTAVKYKTATILFMNVEEYMDMRLRFLNRNKKKRSNAKSRYQLKQN